MSVPADNTAVLKYGASKEDVKEAMGKVRRMERLTKEASASAPPWSWLWHRRTKAEQPDWLPRPRRPRYWICNEPTRSLCFGRRVITHLTLTV